MERARLQPREFLSMGRRIGLTLVRHMTRPLTRSKRQTSFANPEDLERLLLRWPARDFGEIRGL